MSDKQPMNGVSSPVKPCGCNAASWCDQHRPEIFGGRMPSSVPPPGDPTQGQETVAELLAMAERMLANAQQERLDSAAGFWAGYISGIRKVAPLGRDPERSGVGQWQPIDTAPKDGTRVLLLINEEHPVIIGAWFTIERGWCGEDGYDAMPTHWQPLPSPPSIPPEKK